MSSLITHAIVGATIGGIAGRFERFKPLHKLGMTTLGLLCGIAPDLDVVNHAWTRYQDFCGHRGFFHSPFFFLVFAPALALAVGLRAGLRRRDLTMTSLALSPWIFLVLLSHSVLDALTDGGHGVMLYFPVDSGRHFFAWRPIPVSPMGLGFFSEAGQYVLKAESTIFVPCLILLAVLPKPAWMRELEAELEARRLAPLEARRAELEELAQSLEARSTNAETPAGAPAKDGADQAEAEAAGRPGAAESEAP